HGAPVVDPVWSLLEETYRRFGPRPTLLERDFNIPPLAELLVELDGVHARQGKEAVHASDHASDHAAA
ncbi:MAG TPA: DUF692 family protein, partial [Myxococcota bacterium]|nr:DUF692 family protein [Myxococcota bacterium]